MKISNKLKVLFKKFVFKQLEVFSLNQSVHQTFIIYYFIIYLKMIIKNKASSVNEHKKTFKLSRR